MTNGGREFEEDVSEHRYDELHDNQAELVNQK